MTRPDLAAELVQDIINRKVEEQHRDEEVERVEALRKRQRPWLWWMFGLVPMFLIVGAWTLVRAAERPRVFSPEELDASVRLNIFLTVKSIQAFRDSARHYPASLADIGMEGSRLLYVRTGNTFTVSDTTGGVPLVYYAGDDLTVFGSALHELEVRQRMGP
jgi:hypothetical protein